MNCNLLSQFVSSNLLLAHVSDDVKLQPKRCSQNSLNHGFLDEINFSLVFK
jgi:hypothetical protein